MKALLIILAISFGAACTERQAHASTPTATDTVLICKSKNAHVYHRYECRGLKRCTYTVIKTTKAQAIKMGYRACKVCYQ